MVSVPAFNLIEPSKWHFQAHGDVRQAKERAEAYFDLHGTYEQAEYHIEEFVRQWALQVLLDNYEYPVEWLGERIVIEEQVKMGATYKEADISIKNTRQRTYLYIETKTRGISISELEDAERQLETYLASTHTATIGLVTDGDTHKVIRKKIDPNDFEYVADLPSHGRGADVKTRLIRSIPSHGPQRGTGLALVEEQYERLLLQCHNTIRDTDGLHDDEALDELCKVIYSKIFDERETTKASVGTPFRFQTYGAGNASEIASEIRSLYEDAKDEDIRIYSQRIPNYERSRGVFRQQIRLSDVALSQIVDALQSYSLIDSRADVKGRAFQKVLGPAIRAGMGQYFTPDPIVDLAVRLIRPRASHLILDPFCGSGHFLTKCLAYVVEHQTEALSGRDLSEFKFFRLHGIEKSERMVRIAMTDMLLHDDGHTNIRNVDALLSFDNYPDLISIRDDENRNPAIFDLVLTNPPFGSIMKRDALDMLGRFDLGHRRKSLPLEILGLERSIQFLRPGGRLAIVLPEHVLKGKSNRYVRDWLFKVCELKAVISFPEEAFTPYGAMVKTCLCLLRKLKRGEVSKRESKVFLCEMENLGYDATGRPKEGNEVGDVAMQFHSSVGW